MSSSRWSCAALVAGGFVLSTVAIPMAAPAQAAIPPYQLVGQYASPSGTFDVLPDGRLVFISGGALVAADVRSTAAPTPLGGIDPGLISTFGASFVSVSPDGARIAIGDNNFGAGARVHIVSTGLLSPGAVSSVTSIDAPNAEAAWTGASTLFVAGFGSGPVVTRIDTASGVAQTVITNIGGGTGGVASDGSRLYVGLGFDGPSGGRTGQVRAFDLSTLAAVGGPGAPPLDYFSGGLAATALSGSSLGFDAGGNLLVGGGDFFTGVDAGSAAIIDRAAVDSALAGGAVPPLSAQLRLSPAGSAFYSIRFNAPTGELLIADGATIYRYAVPAPAGAGLALLGLIATGRRRRA